MLVRRPLRHRSVRARTLLAAHLGDFATEALAHCAFIGGAGRKLHFHRVDFPLSLGDVSRHSPESHSLALSNAMGVHAANAPCAD
eukprot:SAG31_NODE_2198_length_6212_cov_3.843096_8_plen_85_part_00